MPCQSHFRTFFSTARIVWNAGGSVIDFAFEYLRSFVFYLRVTCLLIERKNSQRIMAPLLESEYKTVFLNKSTCPRLHSPSSSLPKTNVTYFFDTCKGNHTTYVSRHHFVLDTRFINVTHVKDTA